MTERLDAIVIGTGQSGLSLAARCDQEGLRTAVIERHRFGGAWVNVGGIPTKTLAASARVAHVARHSADFGVVVGGPVGVDMKQVKARKDAVVEQSHTGLAQWMKELEYTTVYEGHAQFVAPYAVAVNGQVLEAEKIFINVGTRAYVPHMPGLDTVPYFTNASLMEVDFLPEHLMIIGGGYIGLEFGQMYRRFGSRVSIIERDSRLIGRDDEDVSTAVREILEREGIEMHLDATCTALAQRGNTISAKLDCSGGRSRKVTGSHVLMAVGRRPNTDDLGLDAAGIQTDTRGYVTVDNQLRTNVPGVWAIGDCNGRGTFTHTSCNDHEIVVANLFDDDSRRVTDRILAHALFIDPPLARVGMTEHEVRASGRKALMGKMPMVRVGPARERGETQGFMKALVDAETGSILGATILGVGADEIVHTLLDVMYTGAPYNLMGDTVHVHPTMTELVPSLLGDLSPLSQA